MMMGSSSTPPPALVDNPLTGAMVMSFAELISVLAEPERSKALLREIWEAHGAKVQAKADSEKAIDELKIKRAEHDATIARERKDHEAWIRKTRDECSQQCGRDMSEINTARREANQMRDQARADAAAAAELKNDLERRLAAVKLAAL
jgi:hypothetical protein